MKKYRTLGFLFLAFVLLFSSGCRKVHVYGDSTVVDPASLPTSNARLVLTDTTQRTMFPVLWNGVGGKSLYGNVSGHPIRAAVDLNGGAAFNNPDVVVFALGTNDAGKWAIYPGNPETYPVTAAISHAQYLIDHAVEGGANCVVWVLPTTDFWGTYITPAQAALYRTYTTAFNSALRLKVGNYTLSGNDYEFKVAEWGIVADSYHAYTVDGVHPSDNGASVMGLLIKQQVSQCPAGRWDWQNDQVCNIITGECY